MDNLRVLDFVPLGAFLLDEGHIVRFWNSTLEQWTGISRAQIVGQAIGEFYPHLVESHILRRIRGVFAGEPAVILSAALHHHVIPVPLAHNANGLRVQHTVVSPFARSTDAATYDALFSIQDVTESTERAQAYRQELLVREQVADALQDSESRYRGVSEMISDFAFSLQLQHGVYQRDWVTDAFQYITGYSAADFNTLDDWLAMVHPQDTERVLRVFQTMRLGWADEGLEHRILTRNGDVRYLQTYYRPVVDMQRGDVVRILGAAQDVTHRKRTEDALRASEERFRQIAENLDALVYIADLETHEVLYSNRMFERFFEIPRSTFLHNHTVFASMLPDDARQALLSGLTETLPQTRKLDLTWQMETSRGQGRWLRLRCFMVNAPNEHGKMSRYVGLMDDITEQKHANEREFALMLEREQVQILSAFITDVTHEFRTPLSVINNSVYLLGRNQDNSKRESYITLVQEQVNNISQLVDSLVLMAGLESSVQGDMERVDLHTLLETISDQIHHKAMLADLHFSVNMPPVPLVVRGRVTYLWQAFVSLVDNALRFTPSGGRVTVQAQVLGEHVQVEVIDTGRGIAPENLPRIFERFYREDHAHSTPGFGLGLAIARKIIERYNGKIHAESELNKGSRFVVVLPLLTN